MHSLALQISFSFLFPMCMNIIKFSQFDGKGFGCWKNNHPDVAGVVCGYEEDIEALKMDKIECDE